MTDYNSVYYKIYLDRYDMITVVCMQHFDEDDYDQDNAMIFDDEEDAINYINKRFKPEFIDEEYRRVQEDRWKYMEKD